MKTRFIQGNHQISNVWTYEVQEQETWCNNGVFDFDDQDLVLRVCQIIFNLFINLFLYLQNLNKSKSTQENQEKIKTHKTR